MHFKRFTILALVVALSLIVAACGGGNDEEASGDEQNADLPMEPDISFTEIDRTGLEADTVVATYEGGEITGDQLASYLGFHGFVNPSVQVNEAESRQELLKFLILQETVADEVASTEWAEQKAEELWDEINSVYTEDQTEEAYEKLHTSEEEIKDHLVGYYLMESYFREQIDEDEALAFYEDIQEQITTASVRHILVATEEQQPDGSMEEIRTEEEAKQLADELYADLQEGADFAELAAEHTDDPGSKDNGGLYEDVAVGQWVPEFKQAALEQDIDEIGEPVKTDFGYHIIRVEDRTVTPFEEIEDNVYGQLANDKIYDYYSNTLPDKIEEINIQVEEADADDQSEDAQSEDE
ncbi:peptidylprolyl isomerase [Caldalkalibacillus salinus]|uniref:peptidylprolyl isomerase n=1 Tax=Caldalkalibacillus salinus TaxID=2803787 RepID=UPI001920E919|nr:peptidylprolyl isomerase [Caldalkalibacillus salinus]